MVFLGERRQYFIRLNSSCSLWLKLKNGVPLGSVLDPLLFSLYTHDKFSNLNSCRCHICADDIQMYKNCRVSNIHECVILVSED